MKAVVYENHGGPEVLKIKEVEKPNPNKGEVLIKVVGATYNPVDAAYRGGFFPVPLELPATPGSEVSGIIEELGEDVSNVNVGDKVIVELLPAQGGVAQYVVVPAQNVVNAPSSMDLADAAGVPLVSLTAYQGLFNHAKVKKGDRILVVGAGGSVGGMAVQFAHREGIYVIATATGEDIARVKELGADEVIDYKTENIANAIATKVDAAVIFAPADLTTYYPVIKDGGVLVSAASPTDGAPDSITTIRLFGQNDPQMLREIVTLIDAGEISLPIAFRGTIEDVANIHANPPHSGKAIFKMQ